MARWTMAHRLRSRQLSKRLPIWALLAVSVAGQCPSDAAALSFLRQPVGRHAARVILIEEMPLPAVTKDGDQQRAPLAELHDALAAARARVEVLADTAAVVAAGQLRQELEAVKEENEHLIAEVTALHASRETLRAASQGAEARIAELTEAAKDAAEKAKRLDEELTTLRRQNEQLRTSLAGAESIREALALEARKTQDALAAEVETLSEAAEQSAAENARLGAALQEAEGALRIALGSTSAAQARLAELESAAQSAEADKTRLDEALVRKQAQLAQVEEERDQARAEVAEVQSEADNLRLALAEARNESDRVAHSNSNLQEEVARLRSAASSATDSARQNLRAVESRIKELNAALVGIQSSSEDEGVVGEGLSGAGSLDSGFEAPLAEKWENAAGGPGPSAPTAATDDTETAAEMTTETVIDADLELIKPAAAAEVQLDDTLAQLAVGLPLEKRLQVQGLLVDLGADIDTRGVELIIPGEDLFATDSDAIKPTAYDALAKLAELIEAFDQRQVVIVGHTDSLGEEAYNQILSERRADLVKQFFIDEFRTDGTRLLTEGRGEDQPIASNSTRLGREANRRVEILLMN
jgi:outer membrane protein OmpA-like peptidoglycan-associated protein